jgi:hypothetical protein
MEMVDVSWLTFDVKNQPLKNFVFQGFIFKNTSTVKHQTSNISIKSQPSNINGDSREEVPGGAGVVIALRGSVGL